MTYSSPLTYNEPDYTYAGLIPVPTPNPTVPVATPPKITFFTTDLTGTEVLAELPLSQRQYSKVLNGAGTAGGVLNVEDPRVTNLNWLEATAPNKTCLWVDIGGTLVWGGLIQTRRRKSSSPLVRIGANDHWSYFGQRVQAQDYSTVWATTNTGSAQIAHTILSDVIAAANSLPVDLATPATVPSEYGVTLVWPKSQRMSVQMVVQELSQMGWLVGFDIATDVAYVSGVPTATITLSYPRRGRIAGSTGLVVDLTGENIEWEYEEDGTSQAVTMFEMGASSGGVEVGSTWEPAMAVDGYPLLEAVQAHSMLSPTPALETVLQAMGSGDLAVSAYPVVTPTVTVPMFLPTLPVGEYIVGDDIQVVVPKVANGLPADPRFPGGMEFYFRIIRADFTVPDEGVPTQKLTLAVPPSSTPTAPPA